MWLLTNFRKQTKTDPLDEGFHSLSSLYKIEVEFDVQMHAKQLASQEPVQNEAAPQQAEQEPEPSSSQREASSDSEAAEATDEPRRPAQPLEQRVEKYVALFSGALNLRLNPRFALLTHLNLPSAMFSTVCARCRVQAMINKKREERQKDEQQKEVEKEKQRIQLGKEMAKLKTFKVSPSFLAGRVRAFDIRGSLILLRFPC